MDKLVTLPIVPSSKRDFKVADCFFGTSGVGTIQSDALKSLGNDIQSTSEYPTIAANLNAHRLLMAEVARCPHCYGSEEVLGHRPGLCNPSRPV